MALFFPLMELSCTRVNKIEGEFHYLYNVGTGLNDYQDRSRQVAVDNRVRGQKKYECYKEFDERIKMATSVSASKADRQKAVAIADNPPNVVIDVAYASKDYNALPIDPLRRNTEGKRYVCGYEESRMFCTRTSKPGRRESSSWSKGSASSTRSPATRVSSSPSTTWSAARSS